MFEIVFLSEFMYNMRYFFFLTLIACGGISAESKTDIENAAKTSAAAYKYASDDTPAGALIRATHCSVQAVIRNESLKYIDSGISCESQ